VDARGGASVIGVNLTLAWRLKPQLHKRNLPEQVSKTLIFRQSVPADLVFIAACFHSPELKLAPMCPRARPGVVRGE